MPDCDCVITIRSRLAQNRAKGQDQVSVRLVRRWSSTALRRAAASAGCVVQGQERAGPHRRDQMERAAAAHSGSWQTRSLTAQPADVPWRGVRARHRLLRPGPPPASDGPRRTPRPPQPASAARRTFSAYAAADPGSPSPAAAPSKPSRRYWARAQRRAPPSGTQALRMTWWPAQPDGKTKRPRSSTTPVEVASLGFPRQPLAAVPCHAS